MRPFAESAPTATPLPSIAASTPSTLTRAEAFCPAVQSGCVQTPQRFTGPNRMRLQSICLAACRTHLPKRRFDAFFWLPLRKSRGVNDPRFYCLLISGGQGRAALRGLHTQTLHAAEENIREYFRIVKIGQETPLPLWMLLRSLALQRESKNLSPSLASDFFLAILFGRPFPRAVLAAAAARSRAEHKVTRERAAILRACLIRNYKMEVSMSLDKDNMEPGYRLGRLLAVLERLQSDAQRSLNKSVVDRFYGAASTRPGTVFPSLIRLAQHHRPRSPPRPTIRSI